MIGQMQFKLPEEQSEWDDARNGWRWHQIVLELDSRLRNKLKYTEERGSYDLAREMLWELLKEEGLDPWEN